MYIYKSYHTPIDLPLVPHICVSESAPTETMVMNRWWGLATEYHVILGVRVQCQSRTQSLLDVRSPRRIRYPLIQKVRDWTHLANPFSSCHSFPFFPLILPHPQFGIRLEVLCRIWSWWLLPCEHQNCGDISENTWRIFLNKLRKKSYHRWITNGTL